MRDLMNKFGILLTGYMFNNYFMILMGFIIVGFGFVIPVVDVFSIRWGRVLRVVRILFVFSMGVYVLCCLQGFAINNFRY